LILFILSYKEGSVYWRLLTPNCFYILWTGNVLKRYVALSQWIRFMQILPQAYNKVQRTEPWHMRSANSTGFCRLQYVLLQFQHNVTIPFHNSPRYGHNAYW